MTYAKPKLLTVASTIKVIRGINGKVNFLFLDLDLSSPLFVTITAGTPGAYQADE